MAFIYKRTVRFGDTDAAGVVYFANVLTICHEAYEAALATTGIDLRTFFSAGAIAVPIVHASVDFSRPLRCGDALSVHLNPKLLKESEFEIAYSVFLAADLTRSVSQALTRHVCIDPATRSRHPLPADLMRWLHQWSVAMP